MKILIAIFIITAIILVFITIILWILTKSKPLRYLEDIVFLEENIDRMAVSRANYYRLGDMFMDVYRIDQDCERTDRAWRRFRERYSEYFPHPVEVYQN